MKKLLSFLLAVCLILPGMAPDAAAEEAPATMATFAQFLVNGLGLETPYDEYLAMNFPDFPRDHPNYQAIATLHGLCFMDFGSDNFPADAPITRVYAAWVLCRLGHLTGDTGNIPADLTDEDVRRNWLQIMPVLSCGVMHTYSDNTFRPFESVYLSEIDLGALKAYNAAGVIPDGIYTLTPQCATDMRMGITGGSTENGANIQVVPTGDAADQMWRFTYLGDGYYEIISLATGKALDVESGVNLPETNVQQFVPNRTDAQRWMLKYADDGCWYIVSYLHTPEDAELWLGVFIGDNVAVTSLRYSGDRMWRITPVDDFFDGPYTLTPQCDEGMRMDVAGGDVRSGVNIQVFPSNDSPAQMWNFTYIGDGYYTITSLASGKAMEVEGGIPEAGTNVQQFESNGTGAQRWRLEDAGDGYWYIISYLDGNLRLGVENAQDGNWPDVRVFWPDDSPEQRWKIEKAPIETVVVNLDPQGGAISQTRLVYQRGVCIDDLPVPYRWGYTFTGWAGDGFGSDPFVATEDVTLYAQWQPEGGYGNPCTIHFAADINFDWMEVSDCIPGEPVILPQNPFTPPAGMRFRCWLIDGWEYMPGDEFVPMGDTIARAIWENEAVFNEPQIVVNQKTARAGETVDVQIELRNNPGIVSMQLDLTYDRSVLTLKNVEDSGLLGSSAHNPNYNQWPYRLYWYDDTPGDNRSNGTIATLTFEVAQGAREGTYPVSVSYDNGRDYIFNVSLQPVYFSVENGSVTVSNVLVGDANRDGRVTAIDRTYIARHVAQWPDYGEQEINFAAADVNQDFRVTALDRTILARHLAKWAGYETLPCRPQTVAVSQTVSLLEAAPAVIKVGSSQGQPGGTVSIPISLKNNPGLVSMSFRVSYDVSAMTLVGVEDGGILGSNTFHNPDKTMNPYELSWGNDTITENITADGTIVTLTFEVKENAVTGRYPVTVSYDNSSQDDIYDKDLRLLAFEVENGAVIVDDPSNEHVIRLSTTGNQVNAAIFSKKNVENASLFVAAYRQDGKMLDVKCQTLSLKAMQDQQVSVSMNAKDADYFKAFLTGGTEKPYPLTLACEVPAQKAG